MKVQSWDTSEMQIYVSSFALSELYKIKYSSVKIFSVFLNKLLPHTNILTWLSKWTVQLFRFKLKYIRTTRPNCSKWESRSSRFIMLSGISQQYKFLRSWTATPEDEWPLFSGESVQQAEHIRLNNNAPCEWEWSHSRAVIFNRNFHNTQLIITPKA